MIKEYTVLLLLAFGLSACGQKTMSNIEETPSETYDYELVVPDLSIPWGMAFLPDESLLITEKSGTLIHFKDGEKTEIGGIPNIVARGQGGFMDVELHPDYLTNRWIYFTYSSSEGEGDGANTALSRAKLSGDQLTNLELLYKGSPNSRKGQHFGSRIEFDNDGFLYFSIGDRGARDQNPQDVTRDGGKVYRLNDDGTIPADNPFVGKKGAKEAIFSYGHRNPQGMVLHPETGKIWVHEHGPRGGDEINIVEKGNNYGWPVITYGINYSGTKITDETAKPGMEQPLYYWIPSIGPSGMVFITSDVYPDWKGDLLAGSLSFSYLEKLSFTDGAVVKREKLLPGIGRIRNMRQGPDGYIYVAVEGKGIVKILPK